MPLGVAFLLNNTLIIIFKVKYLLHCVTALYNLKLSKTISRTFYYCSY